MTSLAHPTKRVIRIEKLVITNKIHKKEIIEYKTKQESK